MLIDTCVLSELIRPRPDANVTAWFEHAAEEQLSVSVLTLGEIEKGAERLPRGPKRRRIEEWLLALRRDFADRVLSIDDSIARRWGQISAQAERKGRALAVVDGLLAATALHHGVALVTRNVDDFAMTGVTLLNPWELASKRRGRR